jgi:hypothetical protein
MLGLAIGIGIQREPMERYCTKYFLQKPIEDFPWKNRLLGKRQTVCKECYAKEVMTGIRVTKIGKKRKAQ